MASVIIFGPTGNIASVAALTAAEHGAKVHLAMRDPSKEIRGLSKEKEQSGGFKRVQADLTQPDTVAEAIKTSGAKRAFIYLAHGSPDHMKSTIDAMKGAGVEFVVFLSSFTVHTDKPKRDIPPEDIIDYLHAQVEANLDDAFGEENYVAVRPGAFATNLLRDKKGILEGEVPLYGGKWRQDWITAGDMGRVSGTLLVHGPKNGQKKVYLYGPQLLAQEDAIIEIGKALGKDLKIKNLNADEARKNYLSMGLPPPIVEYFIRKLSENMDVDAESIFPSYKEGVENVKLYTDRPSTPFKEWLGEHKQLFQE